ncbi:hypothetical protein H0H93_001498 [Arthromyces matolae]|nr:hypothetical protein H0H93_001498 [Arthromyces matolae]
MLLTLLPAFLSLTLVSATSVTVKVNKASVIGNYNATTGVDAFLGLKYGTATRFVRATGVSYTTSTTINATVNAPACPQIQGTNSLAVNYGIYGTSEDCTSLDIQRPHGISSSAKLPVMVWLHGGALTQGASWYYPGDGMVQQSKSIYEGNYQALVSYAGCNGTSNTFKCLQTVDLSVLINATNTMYGQPYVYGSRPWGVTIDGNIIPANPAILTAQGKFANIPVIAGDVNDEGTIFVKPQTIATDSDLLSFLENDYRNRNATFFQNATSIASLLALYPDDPTLGSPFGSGNNTFGLGEQFKRAAAIYGDIHFHWARRNFLTSAVCNGNNAWSYLFNQFTPTSAAWQGVFHTGEIPYVMMKFTPADGSYYTLAQEMLAYWVSFAYNKNPNHSGNPKWNQYSTGSNMMFSINSTSMQPDTFRIAGTRPVDDAQTVNTEDNSPNIIFIVRTT